MAVVEDMRSASHSPGFIYVHNHGIGQAVMDNARTSAMTFFNKPSSVKESVAITEHHRGWLRPGGARMDDHLAADLKESFLWGDDEVAGLSDHSLRGPNRWPDQQPGFQEHAQAWFSEAAQLSQDLMTGIARSLGLKSEHFVRSNDRPLSRASFVFYPPQPEGSAGYGVGPHTDFGTLTVLSQDEIGGLEIQNVEGEWVPAPPVEGALVVNVGDLLQRWTGGQFRSAPHRVINTSGRQRLSLVFAFDPNPETLIEPIVGEEPAITCGAYLDERFARAFAHRAQ